MITYCDGQTLKRMLIAGGRWLSYHRGILNELNVFPVPDGDTGTNLWLTMKGALSPLAANPARDVGEIARAAARGALLGARGNSGVILSQILNGFAQGLEGKAQADSGTLAGALSSSCTAAYRSIQEPREGTILTVIRETAGLAEDAAETEQNLITFFSHLASRARKVLVECRDQLPALKEAGVVDAGGLGLVYLLEGMLKAIRREPLQAPADLPEFEGPTRHALEQEITFRYCTEFLVEGTGLTPEDVRPQLEELGDSLVLARTGDLLKIHIHTNEPDAVEALVTPGSLRFRRKVEDMVEQNLRRRAEHDAGVSPAQHEAGTAEYQGELIMIEPASEAARARRKLPPIVAISNGDGLDEFLASWGVERVQGGQTLNPSTEEILRAIQRASRAGGAQRSAGPGPGEEVLVLPNNSNCVGAARLAAQMAEVPVRVLPTRCPSQAVALLADPRDHEHFEARLGGLEAGEVTRAVKDARVQGQEVRAGQFMALWGSRLVWVGEGFSDAVLSLLGNAPRAGWTRVVLVAGEDTDPDQIEGLLMAIMEHHPAARLEFLWGGQPHYPALLTVE